MKLLIFVINTCKFYIQISILFGIKFCDSLQPDKMNLTCGCLKESFRC